MRKVVFGLVIALVAVLTVALGNVGSGDVAYAGKPPTHTPKPTDIPATPEPTQLPPGNDEGDCHGNSPNDECNDDPGPGQDCEEHGNNPDGNEDHCAPTDEPTAEPTDEPTPTETEEPQPTPTDEPGPTATDEPSATPTDVPTATETEEPTDEPSCQELQNCETEEPTPTDEPTATPTEPIPTEEPECNVEVIGQWFVLYGPDGQAERLASFQINPNTGEWSIPAVVFQIKCLGYQAIRAVGSDLIFRNCDGTTSVVCKKCAGGGPSEIYED